MRNYNAIYSVSRTMWHYMWDFLKIIPPAPDRVMVWPEPLRRTTFSGCSNSESKLKDFSSSEDNGRTAIGSGL